MKRIVLVTHGTCCEGLKSSMDVICGSSDNIDTVSMNTVETIDSMSEKVENLLNSYDEKDLIIILTDIAVGTTTKCIFPLFEKRKIYLVSGVNLPMLLSVSLTEFESDPKRQLREIISDSRETMLFINDQIDSI